MKNWKTTVTGIATAIFAALTALAAAPYSLGPVADFIPADLKAEIFKYCGLAAFVTFILKSLFTADKPGPVLPPVDTKKASLLIAAIGFFGFGILFLSGCASDGGAHVSTTVPLGAEAKYGSLKLDVGYYPPTDFTQWPVALPANFQTVAAQIRDGKTIQLPIGQ